MTPALFMILQAAQRASGRRPSILPFVIQLVAIIFIFYFLLIRPQRNIAKKHEDLLSKLARNDEVVTEGGIIGTVVHMDEDRVTLRTGENTRIVVLRTKIARVLTGESTEAKA
jgi:preprotein translocase subunit YajC